MDSSQLKKQCAVMLAGVVIGAGFMLSLPHPASDTSQVVESDTEAVAVPEPIRLRIPSVGIRAAFEAPLDVTEDQAIEVPTGYDTVGYYAHGPIPGAVGPAVVLGHVDSYEAHAVFWPLRWVAVGDEIYIDRADGSTVTFVVTALEDHDQSGFPTEKVYGDVAYPALRLITCSGVYDHERLRYSHNLLVFAQMEERG